MSAVSCREGNTALPRGRGFLGFGSGRRKTVLEGSPEHLLLKEGKVLNPGGQDQSWEEGDLREGKSDPEGSSQIFHGWEQLERAVESPDSFLVTYGKSQDKSSIVA